MQSQGRVLLAVGDNERPSLLRRPLQGAGFRVVWWRDGDTVLEQLPLCTCRAMLLDLDLPPFSGWPILKMIRNHPALFRLPVLAQGCGRQARECEKALKAGADDYFRPPVSTEEIALRLERLAKTTQPPAPPKEFLRVYNLTVDVEGRRVKVGNQSIEMPGRELELLIYLLRHKNQAVSRRVLYREVWRNEAYEGKTLYTHVMRIRRRLGSFSRRIRTLRGYGYRIDDELFDASE